MPDVLPQEAELILGEVTEKATEAEKAHKRFIKRCEHFDGLYHNYRDWKSSHSNTSPPDRDPGLQDAKREWGADLHIPYAFSTVETILPRMLSSRPRMLVLPREVFEEFDQQSLAEYEKNAENMKALIDAQQRRIRYELTLQSIGKSGLIYGLGVQKVRWLTKRRKKKIIVRSTGLDPKVKWVEAEEERTLFDGPVAEQVDIWDWLWDPFATSVDSLGYAIHRAWRSTAYVQERILSGAWNYVDLLVSDVENEGSSQKFMEVWQSRRKAQGDEMSKSDIQTNDVHEILEFHDDAGRVITVLDRKWPVQVVESEFTVADTFQAFRPTEVLNRLHGKGEIEPIEDLIEEMDTLRSMRIDNSNLKLQQPFAYNDGIVDPADIKFGPGLLIGVNGDPRGLLEPIQVGDIPYSSYREAESIQQDIERASGISDTVTGAEGGGAAATATGVQLVQAAANVRIQNKTRRLELEVIGPGGAQFGALNQAKIVQERAIRIPAAPTAEQPLRSFDWLVVSPESIGGEFDYEGGAIAPENVPQNRQDALQLLQSLGNRPDVNQREILKKFLELFGEKHAERYLAPDRRVPPDTLPMVIDLLVNEKGMPPEEADAVVRYAFETATQAEQQGGSPPQQEPVAA